MISSILTAIVLYTLSTGEMYRVTVQFENGTFETMQSCSEVLPRVTREMRNRAIAREFLPEEFDGTFERVMVFCNAVRTV